MNITMITAILVLSAFAFTHITTYLFAINLPPSSIGPIKSKPHFIKGSSRNVVINLVKLFVFNPQILTIVTTSANSWISLNRVGHYYPTSKIFFAIIFVAKCPPTTPSCSSFRTIYAFKVVKHLRILLSYPTLYIIPSFKIKGFSFFANFCF